MTDVSQYGHLIKPSPGLEYLSKRNVSTHDIVELLLAVDSIAHDDTVIFSQVFKPTYDSMQDLYDFVKNNIEYIIDARFNEKVKMPSTVWASKFADCKSLTVFITSVIRNMSQKYDISYKFRFVGYDDDVNFTHVYPVITLNGQHIIMDTVHDRFDQEVPYSFKKDFNPLAIDIQGHKSASLHKDLRSSINGLVDVKQPFMVMLAFLFLVIGLPKIINN